MGVWIAPSAHGERLAGCVGKAAFETPTRADKAIRWMVRRGDLNHVPGERLTRYRCRFCGAWHIGNAQRKD